MSRAAGIVGRGRLGLAAAVLALCAGVLVWRALDLQVLDRGFLQDQGDARHLRELVIPAHRGMITDRNGEPLAISTPVDSIWVNPGEVLAARERLPELARALDLDPAELTARIEQRAAQRTGREFLYLRRHLDPEQAQRVLALGIPGVARQREYRRFYPEGEAAAHLVGITDIDDAGQEGIELGFDGWLKGTPGAKWVLRDRFGRVVEDVAAIKEPAPGRDLALSIDRRIQYLAYRELKAAVKQHRAESASAVIVDVRTGEVLAMVNQPSYNPNNRASLRPGATRNRAVTDVFEPGSTVKAFTAAAALESGEFRPDTPIHTGPGMLRVGRSKVRDASDYGTIDLTTVLRKSSNVGAAKVAFALPPERLWRTFSAFGLGSATAVGFPGESGGTLPHYAEWRDIERATFSFGYGLLVTPLQLALAYAALGDEGRLKQASLVPVDAPQGVTRAVSARTAREVVAMMETVVSDGTGSLAAVSGYRVAGKTGTVQVAGRGGYDTGEYVASFAGVAPASDPRLAMVVVIARPQGEKFYGGEVAAPVFSRVMNGALRLLGVAPDGVDIPLYAAAPRALVDAPRATPVSGAERGGAM